MYVRFYVLSFCLSPLFFLDDGMHAHARAYFFIRSDVFFLLSPLFFLRLHARAHARTRLRQATFGHPGPGHVPTHCLTHCEEGMHRLAADVDSRNIMAARITGNVSRSGFIGLF